MFILSIETSCDETAAALTLITPTSFSLRSNIISSQVSLHAVWGGVVPNLAAREHLKNILPVIEKALRDANARPADIGLIAVTNGPGLIPALLIGVGAAKTLSYLWNVPLIGIHHIEGHIYANFISDKISEISNFKFQISKQIQNPKLQNNKVTGAIESESLGIKFPILCLVVSGGHTQLVLMKKHLDYEIVGETQDDAAGEAFDKVARILDLGYPGGPAISARAEEFRISNLEFRMKPELENSKFKIDSKFKIQNSKLSLPRPMLNSKDFNFSFSGLKTAVLYKFRKLSQDLPSVEKELLVTELAAEFQQAAVEVLVKKTIAAAKKYEVQTVMLAGGVSANTELRNCLAEKVKTELADAVCNLPEIKYTGDNAAMIGAAAYFRWENITAKDKKELNDNWKNLETNANLKLSA